MPPECLPFAAQARQTTPESAEHAPSDVPEDSSAAFRRARDTVERCRQNLESPQEAAPSCTSSPYAGKPSSSHQPQEGDKTHEGHQPRLMTPDFQESAVRNALSDEDFDQFVHTLRAQSEAYREVRPQSEAHRDRSEIRMTPAPRTTQGATQAPHDATQARPNSREHPSKAATAQFFTKSDPAGGKHSGQTGEELGPREAAAEKSPGEEGSSRTAELLQSHKSERDSAARNKAFRDNMTRLIEMGVHCVDATEALVEAEGDLVGAVKVLFESESSEGPPPRDAATTGHESCPRGVNRMLKEILSQRRQHREAASTLSRSDLQESLQSHAIQMHQRSKQLHDFFHEEMPAPVDVSPRTCHQYEPEVVHRRATRSGIPPRDRVGSNASCSTSTSPGDSETASSSDISDSESDRSDTASPGFGEGQVDAEEERNQEYWDKLERLACEREREKDAEEARKRVAEECSRREKARLAARRAEQQKERKERGEQNGS